MSKPKFKIVAQPDLITITPDAIVSYFAQRIDGENEDIPAGTKFRWSCHNDPATRPWYEPSIFPGFSYTSHWKDAKWGFIGKHTIVLIVRHPDGSKDKYSRIQWVDTASNILGRSFDPRANDNLPGPFETLMHKEKEHQVLLKIAKIKPPKDERQKEKHEKTVEYNETYIGHLKGNLEGLEGREGFAVDALHLDRERSQQATLLLWLVNLSDQNDKPTWKLVDWTNPAYRFSTGVYEGSGATHQKAIEDVISNWDSDNRYPNGRIKYEFKAHSYENVCSDEYTINISGEFDTDGKSFWDEVSSWLDYVALGGAVVAGVVTLVAPVPGSRVVSAAIWTSIFTSSAAAVINIAQRHDEGFGNWKDDAFDGLSIVGNLFAGAGMAWKVGATVKSATHLGAKMNKAVLIGQISSDGLQGVLLAADHLKSYNSIMEDDNLAPDERLKKLMELFRSAAIAGTLTYMSIQGARGDLSNLNNNRTLLSKVELENPNTVIDLDQPVTHSVPVGANEKKVKAIVETEPKTKPPGFEENPNARVPKKTHKYSRDFSKDLEAKVKEDADAIIGEGKQVANGKVATSRSGVEGKHLKNGRDIVTDGFQNLGKKGALKKGKTYPGLKRNPDGSITITDTDQYMESVIQKHFKDSLDPAMEKLIKKHLESIKGKVVSTKHGLPGLHAEVQSANQVFRDLRKQGVDLETFDFKKIEVATYKTQSSRGQGDRFTACRHCSGILRGMTILTD